MNYLENLAPICLFVYNRPDHVKTTIEFLKKNKLAKHSLLYIFSDGPKKTKNEAEVSEVRNIIENITGFKDIILTKQATNLGLAQSIISGVTRVVNKHGKVIVIEDDIATSPYFLDYMNEGLNTYSDNKKVASIHGYCYPVKNKLPKTFFIRGADCWGWATWKRAWDVFEPDGGKLLKELQQNGLKREFNFNNNYNYYKMLKNQIEGKNNSWAVRWYASAFLADMLTLYPYPSIVKNIGFDNSGEHSGTFDFFGQEFYDGRLELNEIEVEESEIARAEFERFFKSMRSLSTLLYRVYRRFKRIF